MLGRTSIKELTVIALFLRNKALNICPLSLNNPKIDITKLDIFVISIKFIEITLFKVK